MCMATAEADPAGAGPATGKSNLLQIAGDCIESGLSADAILLGGSAAHADSADRLAAPGLDRQSTLEGHNAGHERDAGHVLRNLTDLLGREREARRRIGLELRDLHAAEERVVLAQK